MHVVGLFEAKTHLSRIVEALVAGKEDQVIISRHGKPVVRVTALSQSDSSKRIGLARGRFEVPDNIDRSNATIASMFGTGQEQAK